jgi:predicted Zn-dependent protease
LACYQKIRARYPDLKGLNVALTDLLLGMNQWRQAMAPARAALQEQDDWRSRLALGQVYLRWHLVGLRTVGDTKTSLERALEHLEQAHIDAKANDRVVDALARAYLVAKKPAEAARIVEPFVAQKPRSGGGYLILAQAI